MVAKKKTVKNISKSIEPSREAPDERRVTEKDLAMMKIMAQKQIEVLTAKTPAYAIKSRPGGGGKVLRYVTHGYVTDQLNKAFGFDWDYKLLPVFDGSIAKQISIKTGYNKKTEEDIISHYITVYGELTVRIHNPQKPAEVIATITKPGPGSSVWFPANAWGDALKSAKSDGLKVAAHELGIGLDLYWDDDAEFNKHSERNNGNNEIIDALVDDGYPDTISELFSKALTDYQFDLPKLKKILVDVFVKQFKVSKTEMWDKVVKEGE
jgi:hypothetical protein